MRIIRSVIVDATREHVWQLLTDHDQIKRWNTDVISDEVLTEGPVGPGTRTRILIREGSKQVAYDNEILEYEEPDRLGMRLTGGSLGEGPMTIRYTVSDRDGHLVVKFDSEWFGRGVMLKLMTPLITLMGHLNARRVMQRLKEVAEAD